MILQHGKGETCKTAIYILYVKEKWYQTDIWYSIIWYRQY